MSFCFPFQNCCGLNNIQYVRKEIEAVPEFFDLTHSDGGNSFSVVTKASSKMEESVSSFMDNAIAKVS